MDTPYHKGINWDLEPLGQISDCELAKKLGVHSSSVRKARIKRNIISFRPMPDYFNKINWEEQPLGEMSDADLARQMGVAQTLVSSQRRKRNIEEYTEERLKIDWNNVPLGLKSDIEIAKELNVSSALVCNIRNKKGIVSWEESRFSNLNDDECWCFSCKSIKNKDNFSNHEFRRSLNTGQCRQCVKKNKDNKLKNDLAYNILCKLRKRLTHAFDQSKIGKNRKNCEFDIDWSSICDHLKLLKHNSDDHIDHVVPLSFFNFNDLSQIKLAFSAKNHCWVNKSTNSRKSDRLLYFNQNGRKYKLFPLKDKIEIYNHILHLFWLEYDLF